MPIRFRCVYCNKLLGIATRKAGTVINCPGCSQALIVPTPEPANSAAEADGGAATVADQNGGSTSKSSSSGYQTSKLFEEDDIDRLLESPTIKSPEPPTNRPTPGMAGSNPAFKPLTVNSPAANTAVPGRPNYDIPMATTTPMQPQPVVITQAPVRGIVLKFGHVLLLIVFFLASVCGAFAGGLYFARKNAGG